VVWRRYPRPNATDGVLAVPLGDSGCSSRIVCPRCNLTAATVTHCPLSHPHLEIHRGGSTTLKPMDEDTSRPPVQLIRYRISIRRESDFAEPISDWRLTSGRRVVIAFYRTHQEGASLVGVKSDWWFATRELYGGACRESRSVQILRSADAEFRDGSSEPLPQDKDPSD
jgi:hypothetical protein